MPWQVGVPPTGHIPSTGVPTPPTACADGTVTAVVEERHALMAIDPGGTTGVAALHVTLGGTVAETLTEGVTLRKAIEVKGYWREQVYELDRLADRFRYTANVEHAIQLDNVHVIMENFLADPRRIGGGATDLSSVWIAGGFAAVQAEEPIWQNPSDKGYAKNERLKRWGLWEVGSEHKRDCWRHIAYRLNRLIR